MNESTSKPATATGMEALPYTVIRIRAGENESAAAVHSGTGFFFGVDFPGGGIPMILTNKHVADNRPWIELDFAEMDSAGKRLFGKPRTIRIYKGQVPIVPHPDPSVDLVAILCLPILDALHKSGFDPYFLQLSEHNFPPPHVLDYLTAASSILMVGYPNGLMDTSNNLPLVRRGTLATHYKADYLGAPNFVADIAAFGGSSGSPIFAYFEGMAPVENGSLGLSFGPSVYLIGVLHSGPVLTAQGDLVPAPIPTGHLVAKINLMMHLGFALKVSSFAALTNEIQKLV